MQRIIAAAILAALAGIAMVVVWRQRQERYERATGIALQEAELAAVPFTAANVETHVGCSMMFCEVRQSFVAAEGDLADWVRDSRGLGRASTTQEAGVRKYTILPKIGDGPGALVTIDDERRRVELNVSIDRQRCSDICDD